MRSDSLLKSDSMLKLDMPLIVVVCSYSFSLFRRASKIKPETTPREKKVTLSVQVRIAHSFCQEKLHSK